jgi:NAD+ synthase
VSVIEKKTMIGKDLEATLEKFIKNQVKAAGVEGVVLGLSGGLDSAVVAHLAVRALGVEKVLALLLPERGVTPREDLEDARTVARHLGLETKEVDISTILECYTQAIPLDEAPQVVNGNLKARIRMTLIYWHANLLHRLVLGTGNKTEIMLGYCTKYGDAAADILPLAGLYKDEVRALGDRLGVPRRILEKAPTAGLWPGQTDEDELGISYQEANGILRGLEEGQSPGELKEKYGKEKVELVLDRIKGSRHKRELPPCPSM